MKIAIIAIGDYCNNPDTIRVFSSMKKAKENIPSGFEEKQNLPSNCYYEAGNKKRWLSIKEYEVEG